MYPALTALCVVLAALLVSALSPYDRLTWWLEVAPVLIAIPVLIATRRRLPLTGLLYALIAAHALVLIYGGTYTYARAPLGFWMADWFGLDRNPYDKIGHFVQGLVPALIAREILLRLGYLQSRAMAGFLSGCVALAISAAYELIEWWAALLLGQGADEFLGTQGYEWDTQADMGFALLGAVCALVLLSRWHDRQLARLAVADGRPTGV
ncbi:DUF2238 domain-containing protein [Chitiniphilus purpureus]|uniref:DUF2238 domain-containing protein n=1 Tax=Chitiniphilus purpureus TaxID=2981137 RepID=A0ABY6DKN1_9NEIS|nr:DUF2238 domain-containing protein [Chitiniphilus sp. CD1]UXY14892.1 DUF2238 domain-containing protein [Chitiniphilus sp. CD1]